LNGRGKQAVDLYHRMPQEYIDEITHVCVLNACSHAGLVDDARQIFDNISHPTAKIITTMVNRNEFVFPLVVCVSISLGRLSEPRWFVE